MGGPELTALATGVVAQELITAVGVMKLSRFEGWPNLSESPDKTWKSLTAPGVTTFVAEEVAEEDGAVIGFPQVQSDGLVQAHLLTIVVRRDWRRGCVGRRFIEEAFNKAAGLRVDLISRRSGWLLRVVRTYKIRGLPHLPG
jgi:hypothetical protein